LENKFGKKEKKIDLQIDLQYFGNFSKILCRVKDHRKAGVSIRHHQCM